MRLPRVRGGGVRGAGAPGEPLVFGGLGVVALLTALLVQTYPNYDSYYALVWGREILDGHSPSFKAYAAPTEHPLWVGWSAVCDAIFGGWADRALVLTAVLSLVALVWAVYRVGRACFGFWPGALAALFVGSSFQLLLFAARAYVDLPFLAFVLWAGAVEARAPSRRPVLVLSLLAVAGLLRPEAWVLSGFYWLWLNLKVPGTFRFGLLPLVLVAPVVWAVVDLSVTGDALFSLHSTNDLATYLGRERGIVHVPRAFVSFLADTARPPVFAAGLVGLYLAWRRRDVQVAHVPYALFAAGVLTFIGTGLVGLSILPRYLTVPTVAIALFAAYAVLGFLRAPPGPLRDWWQRGAIAAAVLAVVFGIVKLPSFGHLADELRFIKATHEDLVATLHDPAVQRARACGPITYPTYRLIPDTRFELHAPGRAVASRAVRRADAGVAMYLVGDKPVHRFGYADGVSRRTQREHDPRFAPVARHGMLGAYAPPCTTAARPGR